MTSQQLPQGSFPTGPLNDGDLALLLAGDNITWFTAPWTGRYTINSDGIWANDPPPHERDATS